MINQLIVKIICEIFDKLVFLFKPDFKIMTQYITVY